MRNIAFITMVAFSLSVGIDTFAAEGPSPLSLGITLPAPYDQADDTTVKIWTKHIDQIFDHVAGNQWEFKSDGFLINFFEARGTVIRGLEELMKSAVIQSLAQKSIELDPTSVTFELATEPVADEDQGHIESLIVLNAKTKSGTPIRANVKVITESEDVVLIAAFQPKYDNEGNKLEVPNSKGGQVLRITSSAAGPLRILNSNTSFQLAEVDGSNLTMSKLYWLKAFDSL